MLHISTLLKHYKRPEIQAALCEAAADREVGMFYGNASSYGKRPDVLMMPGDVLDFVKKGVTSFHISEERWKDPLAIVTGMPRKELDTIRSGWDLVIDIDCSWLDYSKVAAHVICEKLSSMGISCHRVKFSGNHGFHIGVPFEAFPSQVMVEGRLRETRELFPEGPRKIAAYLQDEIKPVLGQMLVQRFTLEGIKQTTQKRHDELIKKNPLGKPYLDPFTILSIDTILIAPRHLVRAPYSLHDKSGLCSIAVDPSQLLTFDKMSAVPEKAIVDNSRKFLDRQVAVPGEAQRLLEASFAHKLDIPLRVIQDDKNKKHVDWELIVEALPETVFPPCINCIKAGIKDGKKRALFAVTNFLVSCGWDFDRIGQWVEEWNKNNPDRLQDVLIKGHLRHHKATGQKMLPPSCRKFYQDLVVCNPDGLCQRVKNPVQYARRKAWALQQEQKKTRKKKEKGPKTDAGPKDAAANGAAPTGAPGTKDAAKQTRAQAGNSSIPSAMPRGAQGPAAE